MASAPAQAADLGGDCCGDLEERIAELEATTARKGNRKVSLTISGYVNEQVQYWNDGVESNVYQGTNESDQTRFRFVGKAKINNDWSAGYILELGVKGASQGTYNASNDEGSAGNAATVSVRHSAWYVESQTYGRVTTGHTSEATDSITELTLAKTITVEKPIQIFTPNAGFQVRSGSGGTIGLTWAQLSTVTNGPGEGDRYDVVRYDSPTFGGFTASASWGEDDMWAVALRYAGEFHGFKLAAGFGYSEITDGSPASGAFGERGFTKLTTGGGHDVDGDEYGGSVSVLHVESGLFATFAYGKSEDHNRKGLAGGGITAAQIDGDDEGWNIQAGVYKKWLPLGPTTIYGEYYQGNFGSAANSTDTAIATAGDGVISGKVLGTQVDVWGAAAVQTIDAAALELYISYRHYDADVTTTAGVLDTKAFDTVFSGAKISF